MSGVDGDKDKLEKFVEAVGLGDPSRHRVSKSSKVGYSGNSRIASQEPSGQPSAAPGSAARQAPIGGMDSEVIRSFRPAVAPSSDKLTERGLREWHMLLADYIILNPQAKGPQIAQHFGVSPNWLSIVRNTDAFKAYFSERLSSHQAQVSQSIVNQAGDVAQKGLERMKEKLDNAQISDISMRDIVSATELSAKMVGVGHNPAGQNTPVVVNIGSGVDAKVLAAARAKMVDLGHHNTESREALIANVIEEDDEGEPELLEWEDSENETDSAE